MTCRFPRLRNSWLPKALGAYAFARIVARNSTPMPVRSRETFDLTAAQELRQMAADLEDKALRCEGIDCDHEQRSMARQRRPF